MQMFKVPLQSGEFGYAVIRVAEHVLPELTKRIEDHQSGEKPLWPEDKASCLDYVDNTWDYLHVVRDEAAFLLSAYTFTKDFDLAEAPVLTEAVMDCLLLSWIESEKNLGQDDPTSKALELLVMNPILHYPDYGTRVNH